MSRPTLPLLDLLRKAIASLFQTQWDAPADDTLVLTAVLKAMSNQPVSQQDTLIEATGLKRIVDIPPGRSNYFLGSQQNIESNTTAWQQVQVPSSFHRGLQVVNCTLMESISAGPGVNQQLHTSTFTLAYSI